MKATRFTRRRSVEIRIGWQFGSRSKELILLNGYVVAMYNVISMVHGRYMFMNQLIPKTGRGHHLCFVEECFTSM